MKIVRSNLLKFIPASHEDPKSPGVWKKILLGKEDLIKGRVQMVNWSKLPVGSSFKPHYHQDMEEVFIILRGKVKITVDEEEERMEKGDVVIIPMKKVHEMKNIGNEEVEYLVLGISLEKGGKTVVV